MKLNQLLSANLRAMALGLSGIFAVANGLMAFGYDFSAKNKLEVEIFYNINPDGNTVTVTYGAEKYNATSIEIPQTVSHDGKEYTVTAIGQRAFENSFVRDIVLPNTITEIQNYAFAASKSLVNINYPASLKNIRRDAFSYTNITNGILPEGLEVVEESAFYGAAMDSLYLPKTLISIGKSSFERCQNISNLTIPGNLKIISKSAFTGCTKLTSVTIEEGVESLGVRPYDGTVFTGCPLKEIKFPSTLTYMGPSCFTGNKFTELVLPDNIKELGTSCFANSSELESIVFSKSMTELPNFVCESCPKLITVTIPEGIKKIGMNVFKGASLLSHVNFPESLTEIETAALGHIGIVDFTFPKNLTYIGSQMFENCENLTELVIPSTIKEIKNSAFSRCSNLRKITLPEELEVLGNSAFQYCSSLTDVNIPANIKELPESAFSDCSGLQKIVIPEGITEIKRYAFMGCSSLTDIELPKSLTMIRATVISGCKSLRNLIIHQNVSLIEKHAFDGCEAIEEIHLQRAVLPESPMAQGWLVNRPVINADNNCTLYVPKGSVESYQESQYWNSFKNIVEEEYAEALNYQLSFPYSLTGGQILVNGEVAKGGIKEFEMGSDIVISTTAKDGYHLRALLVNGKDVTAEMEDGSYTIRNIDANYTVDAEFAENPFILSLFMANGGSLDVDVEKRGTFTCVIVPEEGWKINTVTFNGSDVTSELTEDNRYTTPAITRNSVLRVTFEDMNSAIGSIDYDATSVKVTVDNGGEVRIEGVEAGNPVRAYSVDGRLAGQVTSNGDVDVINLSQHGIYLIQTPGKTFKIQY
ncbi:leucine-rich repeat domain-containing protein [uncultured Duncaniella sp.]|uniref:leucine-rich repeat domain-containing protein n=2 Tax=uncultured Duncaniella sp. TaxID=2768039 RepID=UPI002615DBBE|nr:leucine-rich repeat domain-containing protein [uncultured Duncaniella sp.]